MKAIMAIIVVLAFIAYFSLVISDCLDNGKLNKKALKVGIIAFLVCFLALSLIRW